MVEAVNRMQAFCFNDFKKCESDVTYSWREKHAIANRQHNDDQISTKRRDEIGKSKQKTKNYINNALEFVRIVVEKSDEKFAEGLSVRRRVRSQLFIQGQQTNVDTVVKFVLSSIKTGNLQTYESTIREKKHEFDLYAFYISSWFQNISVLYEISWIVWYLHLDSSDSCSLFTIKLLCIINPSIKNVTI